MPSIAMAQHEADLGVVLKLLNTLESEQYPASARTMLAEGLPHALPVPVAAAGVSPVQAAVHGFQTKFVGYIEQLLAEAKERSTQDGAAAEAKRAETEAQLAEAEQGVAQAAKNVEGATAQVDAEKARIQELQAGAEQEEANHAACKAQGQQQKQEWEELRQLHESAKAVSEGALRMLEEDEGDEEVRASAAEAVAAYIEEQKAEKVLQAAAPLALSVKPSSRGNFDTITSKAVSALINKRVSALGEKVAAIEPVEKELKAETVGLWAIADCARDAVLEAKGELKTAGKALKELEAAHEQAQEKVTSEQEQMTLDQASKARAAEKEEEAAAASAALERLAKPPAEEDGEPDAKRQRTE